MSSRSLALVALLIVLVGAQAGSAGARTNSVTWHPFHIHVNAYGSHGSCTHQWSAHTGSCTGRMEAGSFLGHTYPGGFKVYWSWEGEKVYIALHDPTWYPLQYLHATKPANWFTLKVHSAFLIPRTTEQRLFVSGTTAPAGHQDGPLFVNLSSHSTLGYSLDLKGYLRLK
jgi:hypothetical protein